MPRATNPEKAPPTARPGTNGAGFEGHVDFYGEHAGVGGWFVGGWLSYPWPDGAELEDAEAEFAAETVGTLAMAVFYTRADVAGRGVGFIFFLRAATIPEGRLRRLRLRAGPSTHTLQPTPGAQRLTGAPLAAHLLSLLRDTDDDPEAQDMARLLARWEKVQPYAGETTLGALSLPVHLAIDEVIMAGETGVILMGWLLAHPGTLAAVRVRCGAVSSALDFAACLWLERRDVLDGFAAQGFTQLECGFVAYLAGAAEPGGRLHIEVETSNGEVGYYTPPAPKLEGIPAIKRLLAAVDVRFGQVRPAFDGVLGPAVTALNEARLRTRPAAAATQYGQAPPAPRCSVVIPLYGRLDYVEYQLALFSAHPGSAALEFIYVLDEPNRRREAQFLFASAAERFALPFKAVLLDANVGFAPASNIGLAHARGEFVAFMNSDVFPGTPDWAERLTARLDQDPAIGVIGPVLLFEDGAVQHHGMVFERLPEFGDMHFGLHPDKGMRPARTGALETHPSITGACMVMRRSLALELGGFDEAFAIGDFEDSDLCFRLQALGYRCAVDTAVELFHLERKSQAGSGLGWRMGLTVFNAWQHERRWGASLAAPA